MSISKQDAYLLPRPVEQLPEYAHAKSRQACAERLVDAFKLSRATADAIANAVVDPSEVRKSIGDPADPDVERIPVPGGRMLGLRTSVWTRKVMPDPRNPRLLPSRRHPFAVDPGAGGEESKFRPVPEPRTPDGQSAQIGELVVDIENREHLNWAAQQAAAYVLAENDWRDSIRYQGVMEAVWLTATAYQPGDGHEPVIALTTAEGSSRITATHDILKIRSADVPYEDNDAKLRNHVRKLNDAYQRGPTGEDVVALRCERVPALILVGFEPHHGGDTAFTTAVKSLVALRHVDPPKAWGPGPENESLADEVLDELFRRGLISATQRDYYGGSCTRTEARAAHLSDDPAVRAAQIVRLFTSDDERIEDAIRVAVTSQSTRKRITRGLINDLATALILRAVAEDRDRTDQVRRYLRHAFGGAVHKQDWQATDRSHADLAVAALKEVRQAAADDHLDEPGPASLELAVRGAYALVVSGRLNADRGSAGNDQPDRRTPGQVLDTMRSSVQGVHQLGRALEDFTNDTALRAVDEDGEVKQVGAEGDMLLVNDHYLRSEFPAPGMAKPPRPGDTPLDLYQNRLSELGSAFGALERAFMALSQVAGEDGRPLVEARGVDQRSCQAWREVLGEIGDELVVWGRTYRKVMGAPAASLRDVADDPAEEPVDDAVSEWDAEAETSETA